MADEIPDAETNSGLPRVNVEAVLRRAVELSLQDADPSRELSEDELVSIGQELGLAPRHVRQALYERPVDEAELGVLDRHFGRADLVLTRAVPWNDVRAMRELEDHLVTREYLQLRRRQGGNAIFEPADDAFSSIARAFSRPSSKYHVARAQRLYLTVRPLDGDSAHVRLELRYPEQRSSYMTTAAIMGPTLGLGMGFLAGAALSPLGDVASVIAGASAFTATIASAFAIARNTFRRFVDKSREEAEGLLDRLEQGERLQPPPSPWMRRLQQKLRDFK